jgi:hypothetical protein
MGNIISVVVILLLAPLYTYSQVGISGYYSYSEVSNKPLPRHGFSAGLWFQRSINNKFYWKQSILYTQRGSGKETEYDSVIYNNDVLSHNYNYLEFPAIFYVKIIKSISLGAGASPSFLLSSKKRYNITINRHPDYPHQFGYENASVDSGFDMPLLVALRIGKGLIFGEVVYSHGLVPVINNGYTRSIQAGLNIRLSHN